MKVLVVGSGGREHAICWKISQSPKVDKIYCAPGNAGIAEVAECVDIKAMEFDKLVAFAKENAIDLTVIGMDDPLVGGIVDAFEAEGLRVFGPRKNAVNRLYKKSVQSADMNLTFTLATASPDGEKTDQPGVEYISWPGSYPIDCDAFMNDDINETAGKGYVRYVWDPNRYINIMVYNFANEPGSNTTTLGISHLPFTTKGANSLAGLSEINVSRLELKNLSFPYCVSINSRFINEESTATTYKPADITVTLAHELGHYLGLHHVFSETERGNSCEDTDYCTDTPTYNKEAYDMNYAYIAANEPENFTFANLVNRENCLTGESFVSHNIMDYAISHSDQFTPEQRARIRHVLLYSPLIPGPKAVQEADTRSAPDGLMKLPIRTAK